MPGSGEAPGLHQPVLFRTPFLRFPSKDIPVEGDSAGRVHGPQFKVNNTIHNSSVVWLGRLRRRIRESALYSCHRVIAYETAIYGLKVETKCRIGIVAGVGMLPAKSATAVNLNCKLRHFCVTRIAQLSVLSASNRAPSGKTLQRVRWHMDAVTIAVLGVILVSYLVGSLTSSVETEKELPHHY
jgi:hypothetical protein